MFCSISTWQIRDFLGQTDIDENIHNKNNSESVEMDNLNENVSDQSKFGDHDFCSS